MDIEMYIMNGFDSAKKVSFKNILDNPISLNEPLQDKYNNLFSL